MNCENNTIIPEYGQTNWMKANYFDLYQPFANSFDFEGKIIFSGIKQKKKIIIHIIQVNFILFFF